MLFLAFKKNDCHFLFVKLNKSGETFQKIYLHNLIKLNFLAVSVIFRKKKKSILVATF